MATVALNQTHCGIVEHYLLNKGGTWSLDIARCIRVNRVLPTGICGIPLLYTILWTKGPKGLGCQQIGKKSVTNSQ